MYARALDEKTPSAPGENVPCDFVVLAIEGVFIAFSPPHALSPADVDPEEKP